MDTDKPSASDALGVFLRARRAQLSPRDAGLPASGRRRVPGLRREEVARLAGVSTDYYVRLEQGRRRRPSQQVLDAVAKALRLDGDAMAELNRMATVAPRARRPPRAERVSPYLRRLIESWTDTPVFVLGRSLDVLAGNQLARALSADFAHCDNVARMTFLDPAARGFFHEWRRAAVACAAALRRAADIDSDEPGLVALVGELSVKCAEFQSVWARSRDRAASPLPRRFHHSEVGDVELLGETFTADGAPGQRLLVYQAEAGSRSADALALLGSWRASSSGSSEGGEAAFD